MGSSATYAPANGGYDRSRSRHAVRDRVRSQDEGGVAAWESARHLMVAAGLAPPPSVDPSGEKEALLEAARELTEAVELGVLTEPEAHAVIKALASRFVERYFHSVSQGLFQEGALPEYEHGSRRGSGG